MKRPTPTLFVQPIDDTVDIDLGWVASYGEIWLRGLVVSPEAPAAVRGRHAVVNLTVEQARKLFADLAKALNP
jgi:hypothetical protein